MLSPQCPTFTTILSLTSKSINQSDLNIGRTNSTNKGREEAPSERLGRAENGGWELPTAGRCSHREEKAPESPHRESKFP